MPFYLGDLGSMLEYPSNHLQNNGFGFSFDQQQQQPQRLAPGATSSKLPRRDVGGGLVGSGAPEALRRAVARLRGPFGAARSGESGERCWV